MNHVRFGSQNPKIIDWHVGEDLLLFESFIKHGSKWVLIAKEMPGRYLNIHLGLKIASKTDFMGR